MVITMSGDIEKDEKSGSLSIRDCGVSEYRAVHKLQHELHEKRRRGEIGDTILIAEHRSVITLGARERANQLLTDIDTLVKKHIDVVETRRGGGTTAHNPGQLVFYPILNLDELGFGINEYIRELETTGVEMLKLFGVSAQRRKGFPGLWVGDRKIASIGVRASKGVTSHGMAINIYNDLSIFEFIVPCGLDDVEMTSVLRETGEELSMEKVKESLCKLLVKHFSKNHFPDMSNQIRKLPSWLRRPLPAGANYNRTSDILTSLGLETICNSANCPNRGECWTKGTATVLILGDVCTRNCGFCSVKKGRPKPPDATEPTAIAQMAEKMGLKYLVITSVDRDDLADGGAGHFRDCIIKVGQRCPDVKFEILTPDFRDCQVAALKILGDALPFVFAHNIETVPRLYSVARGGGDYRRSLNLLEKAKDYYKNIETKSSIMLGLGEVDVEVEQVLKDLRCAGCDRITIGQYLKPSKDSLEVAEYIRPEKFDFWKEKAVEMGFNWVCSEPFARSSYRAEKINPT